ncbi:hypothetical protein J6W34_08640 [bacterium]|nr:hypothetical protein [bacterium]
MFDIAVASDQIIWILFAIFAISEAVYKIPLTSNPTGNEFSILLTIANLNADSKLLK